MRIPPGYWQGGWLGIAVTLAIEGHRSQDICLLSGDASVLSDEMLCESWHKADYHSPGERVRRHAVEECSPQGIPSVEKEDVRHQESVAGSKRREQVWHGPELMSRRRCCCLEGSRGTDTQSETVPQGGAPRDRRCIWYFRQSSFTLHSQGFHPQLPSLSSVLLPKMPLAM